MTLEIEAALQKCSKEKVFWKYAAKGEHPCQSVISIKLQSNYYLWTIPFNEMLDDSEQVYW